MIKELFQRRQIRKYFSPFLPKEKIDKIVSGKLDQRQLHKLKQSPLEIVLVAVRGKDAQHVSDLMGVVADLAIQYNGVVQSLVSSLVIIVFGTIDFPKTSTGNRVALVKALQEQLGSDIKIVHGVESGYFGNIGSTNRLSYSFIIPNFLEALGQLSSASFGEVIEISSSGLTSRSS
jgi:hypothetical protein